MGSFQSFVAPRSNDKSRSGTGCFSLRFAFASGCFNLFNASYTKLGLINLRLAYQLSAKIICNTLTEAPRKVHLNAREMKCLPASFFRRENGSESVRDWLLGLEHFSLSWNHGTHPVSC